MSDARQRVSLRHAPRLLAGIGLALVAFEANAANLGIVKSGGGNVTVGTTVTFTLSATNYGPSLPGGVVTTIIDTVPSLFNQVTVTSAPGWNCGGSSGQLVSCTRSVAIAPNMAFPVITVTAKANAVGAYLNCAHVSFVPNASTLPDQAPGNDKSCVTGQISPGSPLKHDVQLKKSGGGTVASGGAVTFTLNAFNVGPGAIGPGDVTVSDPLLAGFTLVSASGSGWTCGAPTVSCTYNGTVAGGPHPFPPITVVLKAGKPGSFNNCASVAYVRTPGDTDMGNNRDCAPVTVTGGGTPHDVKITKRTLPGTPHVGYPTAFSLNPVNVGPGTVSSSPPNQVTVTDTLPPGFVLITLGSGPDWNCTHIGNPVAITCTYIGANVIPAGGFFPQIGVTARPTIPGPYVNKAQIQYNLGPDTNPADNIGSVSGVVAP